MHTLRRCAVAAGDVAALEAAVEHVADRRLTGADLYHCSGNRCIGAAAIGRAKVQVWQTPLKQPGDLRTDAVRVPQQHMAVQSLQALQLGGQGLVVGLPIGFAPAQALDRVWLCACPVQGVAGEKPGRAQLGVGCARVHGRVIRRAVQIDHVARDLRRQQAGAQVSHKVVEPVQVPVGVFGGERTRHIVALQLCRDHGAKVRHADQQRRPALVQGKAHSSSPAKMVWRCGLAPMA